MKRLMVGVASAAAVIGGFGGGIASAGPQAVPGCVGESVSANAQVIHPYGGFISAVTPRNDFGSLGETVQALQAGQIPDSLYSNTCN